MLLEFQEKLSTRLEIIIIILREVKCTSLFVCWI